MIFMVVIIVQLFYQSWELYWASKNEFFAWEYPLIYAFAVAILLVAAIMAFAYMATNDGPDMRDYVPIAFLTAAIACVVICVLIIIYMGLCY